MTKIRLARYGKCSSPFYRIVLTNQSRRQQSSVFETLGFWNPTKKEQSLNMERISYWIKKGAQLTSPVSKLIKN